jgi:hypothetical protein
MKDLIMKAEAGETDLESVVERKVEDNKAVAFIDSLIENATKEFENYEKLDRIELSKLREEAKDLEDRFAAEEKDVQ